MATSPIRVATYARVSTADKDQNPDTQLLPLREFVQAQAWTVAGEWVDQVSATDMAHRTQWRALLALAAKRKIDILLVWRLDRAFRSVLDAANTLERLRGWGVGLRSYQEPWLDTTSPFGEALYYITVAYAQLERGILAERTKAGMDRAKKQGIRIGRPPVTSRLGFDEKWTTTQDALRAGTISRSQAAKQMKIGYATLLRLLKSNRDT